eukprot:jgi/Hompol1/6230/HPOL_004886-RA
MSGSTVLASSSSQKLEPFLLLAKSAKNAACVLYYDQLLQVLDMSNVRDVEDLVIDAIYQNIINGKLDQKKKCLTVEYAMGRDVRPDQVDSILHILKDWLGTAQVILDHTDKKIQSIRDEIFVRKADQENYDRLLEEAKNRNKAAPPLRSRRSEPSFEANFVFSDDRADLSRGLSKRKGKDGRR